MTAWKFFSLVTYLNILPVHWGYVHTLSILKMHLFVSFLFFFNIFYFILFLNLKHCISFAKHHGFVLFVSFLHWLSHSVYGQCVDISHNDLQPFFQAINGEEAKEGTRQWRKSLQRKTGRETADGSGRAARAEMLILVQAPAILSLAL